MLEKAKLETTKTFLQDSHLTPTPKKLHLSFIVTPSRSYQALEIHSTFYTMKNTCAKNIYLIET